MPDLNQPERKEFPSQFVDLNLFLKLVVLNYLAIESEKGRSRRNYAFFLGLPLFIASGMFLVSGDDYEKGFSVGQVLAAGLSYFLVFGATRLTKRYTSDELKTQANHYLTEQRSKVRRTEITCFLLYYGIFLLTLCVWIVVDDFSNVSPRS